MKKVFIDGSAGTTGLRIRERLVARADVELIVLEEARRKDVEARREALNAADVAFLCLPDAAAREAVTLVSNPATVLIDTSTAHRVNEDWAYGMAELAGQRERIAASKRIANPGCHASGFILPVAPLVRAGLLDPGTALCCFSLTGYSGGGKKMIAEYEASDGRSPLLDAPRQYGLTQSHKHLPEMAKMAGLSVSPAFSPIVADFHSGMEVTVPIFARDLKGTRADVADVLRAAYPQGSLVHFEDAPDEEGFLSANVFAGRDDMEIALFGNDERMLLVARFDNLGKGASGAAIQNMNIALGLDERTGLVL